MGKRHAIKYRIVVMEENSKLSGDVNAVLGFYSPKEKKLNFEKDLLDAWLKKGATPTASVAKLLDI